MLSPKTFLIIFYHLHVKFQSCPLLWLTVIFLFSLLAIMRFQGGKKALSLISPNGAYNTTYSTWHSLEKYCVPSPIPMHPLYSHPVAVCHESPPTTLANPYIVQYAFGGLRYTINQAIYYLIYSLNTSWLGIGNTKF